MKVFLKIKKATFEDSLLNDALEKKHSTTKEAIESGEKMNAYRVLLTHFSQRYPKIPFFDTSFSEKTCIAYDFMKINIKNLKILPSLNPIFQEVFAEEIIEDENDEIDEIDESFGENKKRKNDKNNDKNEKKKNKKNKIN
jgi:ribonuclease Z